MTRITMNIIEYSVEQGLSLEWEDDFRISVTVMEKDILISANNAGLVSLARHLLTLAQVAVPDHAHVHFDDMNGLEDGAYTLIIQKTL